MEQKKQRIAVAVCLALFITACLLSSVFSKNSSGEWDSYSGSQIVISEILASNRTYPTPEGELLDFIEVHNVSASAVDISGYMLSDDLNSIGYTFPDGTVLPAYGYLVCWCKPDSEDAQYASFGISRDKGETVYLYNKANVLVDEKQVPVLAPNTAIIRTEETAWAEAPWATPGFSNTEEGYAQWLTTVSGGDMQVIISEVMTDNSCVTTASETHPYDWVELTNTGSGNADLTGAYLSNDPADPLKWPLPSLMLAPGESAVIYCAGNGSAEGCAPFALSKSGCTLTLTSPLGNLLSQIACPALMTDHTWALLPDGSYEMTDRPTPGFENTLAGFSAWVRSVGGEEMPVVISEVMTSNRSTILSAAGRLCDWVELTNTGTATVTLDNAYLSDDPEERGKWRIPSLTLAPGESAVIPCAGDLAAEGEADFALRSSGCTLILSGAAGNILSKVECPDLDADRSWALQTDGTYLITDAPSPGYPNTEAGYLAYRTTQLPLGALAITEVMSTNGDYMIQSDGRYYDWIELTNISGASVNLSDYYLSNDESDPTAFQLPRRTLAPGERIVLICSGDTTLVGNYIQVPFTLSAEECWVYVTDSNGAYSDYLRIKDVPDGCSMGRADEENGTFYFAQPTPGRANSAGAALISQTPTVLTAPGIYNDVSAVTVELQGPGSLHYTTDGSIPTSADPIYTGPIDLTATTVLRVIHLEEGKLPSPVVTAPYFLNENHSLPVLSLTADPAAVADLLSQAPFQDQELPCSLSLFEEGGGFTLDCGAELMGTNTAYPEKKSLKVNFRSRYGAAVLGCPLFGEEGPQVFDSLCIQANREHIQTLFRDELFSTLCLELSDTVPARHSKFCVLYINGAYYGIYSLKEDISEMLYSQHMAVAEAGVTMVSEPAEWGSDLHSLANFCKENDMALEENYNYLASQVDMDSLIDWMILQGYCCNDNISSDLRFFRSPEDGSKWRLGFFDLDGGFSSRTGFEAVLNDSQPYQYLRLTRSVTENPAARQQFLKQLQSALGGTLSKDHVLACIDALEAQLAPEIQRERERWGGDAATWQADVDRLRSYLVRYDHEAMLIQSLEAHMGLTDQEKALYFGR